MRFESAGLKTKLRPVDRLTRATAHLTLFPKSKEFARMTHARRRSIQLVAVAVLSLLGSLFTVLPVEARNSTAYGYGQCRKCDCSKFRGSGNYCKCDHGFYDHQ